MAFGAPNNRHGRRFVDSIIGGEKKRRKSKSSAGFGNTDEQNLEQAIERLVQQGEELVRGGDIVPVNYYQDPKMIMDAGYSTAKQQFEEYEENLLEQAHQHLMADTNYNYITGHQAAVDFDDIVNKTDVTVSAEQQILNEYLKRGSIPEAAPPDRTYGADYNDTHLPLRGIDGEIKYDSEVRGHTQYLDTPIEVMGVKMPAVDRMNVNSEYFSDRGREESFNQWAANEKASDRARGITDRTYNPSGFNTKMLEYYAQQGHLLAGYLPVPNHLRSYHSNQAYLNGKPGSTMGTDRLIENTDRISTPEVTEAQDLRMLNPNMPHDDLNAVMVRDVEGLKEGRNARINLIKKNNISERELNNLRWRIPYMSQASTKGRAMSIDSIMQRLNNQENSMFGQPVVGNKDLRYVNPAFRAGKFMSNTEWAGQHNGTGNFRALFPGQQVSQFQMDDMVFAQRRGADNDLNERSTIPYNLLEVNGPATRDMLADMAREVGDANSSKLNTPATQNQVYEPFGPDTELQASRNSIDVAIPVQVLRDRRVARDLLPPHLMKQLAEGRYNF